MTKEEKEGELKKIRDEIFDLKKSPLYVYRTKNKFHPVIGEGNHNAKIMIIGEAPGKNEALTGRPFCGAAGKFLDQL
ncbi:MAG: uracil-DNA glycosylase, partial [Patescibacteria group bacterium]|nr:uracil-DNA glycosylase [Patescibacteria group bacterium]